MKKIFAIVAIAWALTGCDALDHKLCRDSVVRDVGTQNVAEVGPFKYVAKDKAGNVWYYETMNQTNAEVSKKTPVFFAQN